jgi:hypothetical protein
VKSLKTSRHSSLLSLSYVILQQGYTQTEQVPSASREFSRRNNFQDLVLPVYLLERLRPGPRFGARRSNHAPSVCYQPCPVIPESGRKADMLGSPVRARTGD